MSASSPPSAPEAPEPRSALRERLGVGAIAVGVVVLAVSVPIADHYLKRVPGNAQARAFLAAVRENRPDELRRLASPAFAQEMERAAGASELGRSLERLRSSAMVELDADRSAGFDTSKMGWTVGCVYGSIEGGQHFALAMRKTDGTWRIEDVRTETPPPLCVPEDLP
jgi:hypothetical protein